MLVHYQMPIQTRSLELIELRLFMYLNKYLNLHLLPPRVHVSKRLESGANPGVDLTHSDMTPKSTRHHVTSSAVCLLPVLHVKYKYVNSAEA